MWYLAECRDCYGGEIPFDSFEARNEWAGQHVAGTGHVVAARQWLGHDPTKSPGAVVGELRAQADTAIAASQARVAQYELFAERATALSDHVRAQMPAMWTLTAVAVVGAVTVPVEMWQALASTWGWPQLPYQVGRVAAVAVPMLVLGLLLLARHTRTGVVFIAAAVTWVVAVELFWTAPAWAQSVAALVNVTALGTYLWVSLRRVRGLRAELQQLQASCPGPGGP